jgi:phthalate 4,5-dioxygenase oxygenase subunit
VLTREENELLCRVEGDAPAGQLLRRYWLPVTIADELAERDGTPVRARILGRNYVLFRDWAGQLGMLDEQCPHRLASLGLGRNEEGGLRCIYHGWKFDVHGRCVDMPTEPTQHGFAQRLAARSYPVREAGALVWAYVGPPEKEPAFPAFDWTLLARKDIAIIQLVEHTNYAQALEGGIDTAHTQFLHRGIVPDEKFRAAISSDTSPRLEAEDTAYGFRYAAIRRTQDPERTKWVRVTPFVFPTTVMVPRPIQTEVWSTIQLWTPMDDTRTMHFTLSFRENGAPVDEPAFHKFAHWYPGVNVDPNFEMEMNERNGWNQDRQAMKDGRSFTGIEGFAAQDIACQESMGPIVDRRGEHLGTSDVAIIRWRRRMLENIQRVMNGEEPIGQDGTVDYGHVRSEQRVIAIDEPWQQIAAFAGEYAGAP